VMLSRRLAMPPCNGVWIEPMKLGIGVGV